MSPPKRPELNLLYSVKSSLLFSSFGCCISKRIPLSDNLEIATSVVVPLGGPKRSPRTSIYCCYIYIFFFAIRVALNPGLGSVRDVVSAIIS